MPLSCTVSTRGGLVAVARVDQTIGMVWCGFVRLSRVASALAVGSFVWASSERAIARDSVFVGTAHVLDGDTIELNRANEVPVRIRLEGIDAPEGGQRCARRTSDAWDCGQAAAYALRLLVDGREVTCSDLGLDRYNRVLGICLIEGRDINAEMVRSGLAWAFVRYSNRYVVEEAEARSFGRGVWQAPTMPPWDWREQQRRVAAPAAPVPLISSPPRSLTKASCDIKGAVTRSGRIYHTSESPWYERVRMSLGLGRRWFCSEAEAQAAGWRPVVRR